MMPGVDSSEARRRFAVAAFARLATVRPNGSPHLVPVVFALDGDVLTTAVDHKPKSTRRLQRLENLRHEPRCSLLVDHTDEDWSRLWWVRADGIAEVVDAPPADHPGLQRLVAAHETYRQRPPDGPLIVVRIRHWTGWTAAR